MITYKKTKNLFWIRIFGIGFSATNEPNFSQRNGISGIKIWKFYVNFLPYVSKELKSKNNGYYPDSLEGGFVEKIKQFFTGCRHDYSITATNGYGLPCEAQCIFCGEYRHRVLKSENLTEVPKWEIGQHPLKNKIKQI